VFVFEILNFFDIQQIPFLRFSELEIIAVIFKNPLVHRKRCSRLAWYWEKFCPDWDIILAVNVLPVHLSRMTFSK